MHGEVKTQDVPANDPFGFLNPFDPTASDPLELETPVSPDSNSPITITAERRASASPFPSPGSSFLPPPIPGAHEFAIKVPAKAKRMSATKGTTTEHKPQDGSTPNGEMKKASIQPSSTPSKPNTAEPPSKPNGVLEIPDAPVSEEKTSASSITPTNTLSKASTAGKDQGDDLALKPNGIITIPSDLNAPSPPITPKPQSSTFINAPSPLKATESPTTPTDARVPSSAPVITSPPPPATPSSAHSLSSSRPAPPSPAASRRTSRALSHRSGSSRPASAVFGGSSRRVSPKDKEKEKEKKKSILVKIRDFAFAVGDPRHTSNGPDTPRPTRRLQRPMSTWSTSSAGSSEGGDEDSAGGPGNGWSMPWGLRRIPWFSGGGGKGEGGAGPSAGDLARNFEVGSPTEEEGGSFERWGAQNAGDELSDEDPSASEDGGEGEEGELAPGVYRALYAFDPEGTAEMALEEDQLVRIVGRGGGVGWAVALREDGEHALVPEGYLEFVRADE
ncbi:unnamed protein product [Peniophora sp. CBMAI 1063]|nr:unnamed protein product [Peniophora sp. CBMAI 1063]